MNGVDRIINDAPATDQYLQPLVEVNMVYDSRTELVYDPLQERYVHQRRSKQDQQQSQSLCTAATNTTLLIPLPQWLRNNHFWRTRVLPMLSVAFVPSGVTSNYYHFMQWRILQRFVNANLHVFGTQSLLLGLGIRDTTSTQLGALSAALKWVLKDALGKVVRMLWASRMGRRFDSDAKRWRMRAAFVYAAGNGLEIATYIFPHWFLLWATAANCCKQISMLTSSSTRSSIFFSFRDGSRENIADITAKGEAQVAVVDLMGIASGVWLSKSVVGTSIRSILAVYFVLQTMEILFVYKQLRAVQYRVFNFERMIKVLQDFCSGYTAVNGSSNISTTTRKAAEVSIETPQEMAQKERMFLPPRHLARRQIAFGSLGRSKLSPEELDRMVQMFAGERFLLAVGENVKYPRYSNRWQKALRRLRTRRDRVTNLQENCHIVLHAKATNVDIVKSTLALTLLRRKLASSPTLDPSTIRSSDCYDLLEASLREANQMIAPLLRQIANHGWESPARFMFGTVKMRAEWPLLQKPDAATAFANNRTSVSQQKQQ